MSVTRRSVLAGMAALPALLRPAWAEIPLGQGTLSTLSDGSLMLPGDFLFAPMPQAELTEILTELNVSRDQLTPECNLALYQDGTNRVLFDVGSGPDFMPSSGQILASLEAKGLSPEDITHVVFTHAHPDHIWGLLDDFDEPVFTEATYMMGRKEWDYWWDPNTVQAIGEARAAFAVGAKRRMEIIEDSVVLLHEEEILPGINAIATHGHTPGHMSFEIRQGSDAALILGDAIVNHHVALRKPDWLSGPDHVPEQAAQTRLSLLDRITQEQMRVVGFHLPGGGIGYIEARSEGYSFLPEAL